MNISQKIYLSITVLAIAIVLLFIFAIKPLFLEIKKTSALAAESREKVLAFEKIDAGHMEQAEEDYKVINENIGLIKNQFINNNEAVNFFEALELIASSTNNKLEINAANFPDLTLNLIGNFPDLMKFLGWLENGDYFINVELVNIRRSVEKEEQDIVQSNEIKTNLKIKAYTSQ